MGVTFSQKNKQTIHKILLTQNMEMAGYIEALYRLGVLGLCYPSNLLLEYSASTLASTRVLA